MLAIARGTDQYMLMTTRTQIQVRGVVQGVGFRPYVFSLAVRSALRGRVLNNGAGVLIDVEGEAEAVAQFVSALGRRPPPLAQIEAVERRDDLAPANYRDFRIVESDAACGHAIPVAADVATCGACLEELFDPRDRRYRYPFINCADCGPRFTLIEGVPYDRALTTMRDFAMCEECRAEYENPLDRRFHAEPTACALCGPRLRLTDGAGATAELAALGGDVPRQARALLLGGRILAIKGLGGFHLACDALNAAAVERLRSRKRREEKPFALMADSLEIIRQYCLVSTAEAESLCSARRPIVLLEGKPGVDLPRPVAPGVRTLGFMLPYTPLHHLLLDRLDRPLVMTSGNLSDEPICYEDGAALRRLRDIADYFLLHDRRIHMRMDDSVARPRAGHELILRRSRGYAPAPVRTSFSFDKQILACGAELKNTFCLARGNQAFISHHIGDLENLETLRSFEAGIAHFKRLFNLRPEAVAYDLHPEYLSTKYALALDDELVKVGVQHHHAHIGSCLADNGVEGEVIGVALDGLGFGADGRLWGGEFFVADFAEAERVAHLDYVPMPGGAQAIREPWRMAAVYLHRAFGEDFPHSPLPFARQMDRRKWAALRRMIATGTNCPETSSMGRLFDAVASLLGLRHAVSYEGQAAIELETLADRGVTEAYEFEIGADCVIKAERVIQGVVEDLLEGRSAGRVSAKFHQGVAGLIAAVARRIRDERGLNRVALSGGVFQNALLLESACRGLEAEGFEVFTHRRVPPNDGGLALGQAAVANARLAAGRI